MCTNAAIKTVFLIQDLLSIILFQITLKYNSAIIIISNMKWFEYF